MKYAVLTTFAILATTGVAEAKGGKQVFMAPPAYDYSREQKPGYKKDYCEDAVGNHLYCATGVRADAKTGRYISTFQAH